MAGPAPEQQGFHSGVVKWLGAGIIWQPMQINAGITQSLVLVGPVDRSTHM